LFPIQLAENKLLLDDYYNANVGSMTAAVQVLSEMPGYRVMVVGDMAELGDESEACLFPPQRPFTGLDHRIALACGRRGDVQLDGIAWLIGWLIQF
ncbi:glutamate ligase domain-containing protein, partial [Enterobacter hormaechei]|uniref:glutamate ligase domain-containing protein n=1 Tax=Enterobacter hormaechei TaxID=158836 RepID=UPI0023EDC901